MKKDKDSFKLKKALKIFGDPNNYPSLKQLVKIRVYCARSIIDINNLENDIFELKSKNIMLVDESDKLFDKYSASLKKTRLFIDGLNWALKKIDLKSVKKGKAKKHYNHLKEVIKKTKEIIPDVPIKWSKGQQRWIKTIN